MNEVPRATELSAMPAEKTWHVVHQAFVHMLSLALLAFGGIGLLGRLLFQAQHFGRELLPLPGGALAAMLAGLALAAAIRQARPLFKLAGALLAALCLSALARNLLADTAGAQAAWLGSLPRLRSPLALAGLLWLLGLHLGQQGNGRRHLARGLGLALILIGSLALLAPWLPALDMLRLGLKQASTAFGVGSLLLVLLGTTLALWPRQPLRPLDRRSLTVGALSVLITCSAWLVLSYQAIQYLDESREALLSQVEARTRQSVAERAQLVQRMAERWQALGALPDPGFWRQEARSYLRDVASLEFLAVLDAQGRTHWVESHAQAERRLHLEAFGAGRRSGALISVPLRLPGHPGWLLVAALDASSLFRQIEQEHPGFVLRIEGEAGGLLHDGGSGWSPHLLTLVGERRLDLHHGQGWRLQAYHLDSPRKLFAAGSLPALAMATGLAFTLFLMVNQSLGALVLERSARLAASLKAQARSQALNQRIMDHSQDVLCSIDAQGRFTQLSPSCSQVFGYRPAELIGRRYLDLVLPEEHERTVAEARRVVSGQPARNFRSRHRHRDGHTVHVLWSASWSREDLAMFAVAHDVTELAQQVALVEAQSEILRMISSDRPLEQTLDALCRMVEAQMPDALCAALLTDESAQRILVGAAPSLPEAYHRAIHGAALGPQAGSCGSAVFRRETVVVEDIRQDPSWRDCLGLAEPHGLRACWSLPLLSRNGQVLGSLAVYHRQPHRPDEGQLQRLATMARVAALAIERSRDRQRLATSEQRFRSLYSFNPDPVFSLDMEGRFIDLNDAAMRLSGYGQAEFSGQHWEGVVVKEDRQRVAEHFAAARSGEPQHYEARIHDHQGRRLTLDVTHSPMVVDGRIVGMFGIAKDISERKASEQSLRLLQRCLEASHNGVVIVDAQAPDMPIIYVNPAFERITGYRRDEALGRNCRFLQGEHRDRRQLESIRLGLSQAREVHVVLRNVRKDGSTFWNDLSISPVLDGQGRLSHFVGVQNDISDQKRYQDDLRHNASHDQLTGLPNRALLEDRLRQACRLGARSGRRLAIMFVDLDGFKPINDAFGHACGDQLLVEVARRMQALVRPGDTVARMGGDEFIVLLQDLAHEEDVLPAAERLIEAIARPYRIDDMDLHVTASIGIALSDSSIEEPMSLVQRADLAMFQAKQEGRNHYQWYSGDLDQRVNERLTLRNELQKSIDQQQFELHYQPQIDGASGRVVGMEALLRWRHPQRGMVSPALFIPVAEDSGQIVALGQWALDKACAHAAALAAQGRQGLAVGVNVSAVQFQRGNFVASMRAALGRHGLPPGLLELEITESVLVQNTERVIAALREIKALGVRITLDDFGTGFSSLSYLKRLPIDKLKIDQSFVRNVNSSRHDAAIAQAIISMAHHLGLRVIAEGVETRAQLDALERWGCDEFQGYHFARPMPVEALQDFLAHWPNR